MNRPETQGFQKPVRPDDFKVVGLAVVSMEQAAGRECAQCSCGWTGYHSRLKVLDDRIDRHLQRRHAGRGIRV
jgi:hypothetical protein